MLEGAAGRSPLGPRARVGQPRVAHASLVQALSLGRCVCPSGPCLGAPGGRAGGGVCTEGAVASLGR